MLWYLNHIDVTATTICSRLPAYSVLIGLHTIRIHRRNLAINPREKQCHHVLPVPNAITAAPLHCTG
ncbi:hypothetical protein BN2475_570012 [Paraburkholderia ribeironis]|uniref:Uncharacterized protein n=1 Tax=Paraburkholderia ribeironis TaxID=1247936 RepID=A0A1N7SDI7_9BURK|nr:hypothetical protein BN2475_570012 [Paraburkholderia ribeironis]